MPVPVRTAIALCLAALGCGGSGGGGGPTGPAPIETITVSITQASMVVGDQTTATATAKDANGNVLSGRQLNWSSNDFSVATVQANGVVTAVSTGTASITATGEGKSGAATVTVVLAPVATVTVAFPSFTLAVGATMQASVELADANGVVLHGHVVSWSSGNTAVATVSSTGAITAAVTGVGAGTTNIIATSEGHSGSATVTVAEPVASVTVSISSSTIGIGKTTQATATTKDAAGNVLSGRFASWSSDNTSIATVSSAGLVTGVALGSANITATSEEKTGSVGITVAPALGLGSSSEKIKIVDIGGVFTPTLTGPSSATTTFVSRSTTVATVNAQGTITGVGQGQAWIVATAPNWVADSVYVIVPRTTTGPVLRTDLTTFNVTAGSTIVFNVILDTRGTPIGGTEFSFGYSTTPQLFVGGSYSTSGSPAPVVSNPQLGVLRVSLASGSPLTGELKMLQLTFPVTTVKTAGFLTLTLIDLVSPTGADLMPVATSTRIPIIIK
jgi:uncharacterized protein YjdB